MQCMLCMRHIIDESAGYAIFSQPPTKEIASIGGKKWPGTETSLRASGGHAINSCLFLDIHPRLHVFVIR